MPTTLPAKAPASVPRRQPRSTQRLQGRPNPHPAAETAGVQSSVGGCLEVYVVPLPFLSPILVPDRHHDLGLPCLMGQVAAAHRTPMLAPPGACLAHHDSKSLIAGCPDTPTTLRAEGVRRTPRSKLLPPLTCKTGIIHKCHRHLFQHNIYTQPVRPLP